MTYRLDPLSFQSLVEAIRTPISPSVAVAGTMSKIVDSGWASRDDAERLMREAGLPLILCRADLLGAFGIEPEVAFLKQQDGEDAFGFEHYRAAGIASFLIKLEALGLNVRPGLMVHPLRDHMASTRLLSEHELRVWRYPDLHGAGETHVACRDLQDHGMTVETFTTRKGYEVAVDLDVIEEAVAIRVRGPRAAAE